MKFSLIARKLRPERVANFPYPNEEGELVDRPVVLVPLSGNEESEALSFATEYATAKGSKNPVFDDPLFDLAYEARVLVFGCLDPDSPRDARTPFFDGPEQVLAALSRDQRVFLFERIQAWQDEVSPSTRKMTAEQILTATAIVAKGGSEADDFLDRLSPGMQRGFLRFTASQLWSFLVPKSGSSSPSTANTTPS